jgi:hypothetical protein
MVNMSFTPGITTEQENLINKESPVFMRFRLGTYLRRLVDAVATTAGIETLTNKTLTAPTINNGTITGSTIASATITGSTIASATINGSTIASATITGSTIASATINGPAIASPDVTHAILAAIDTSAGDVTLDAAQAKCTILEVTTGHATNAIIAPAVSGKMYFIKNNDETTAVLIKAADGSAPVTIAAKKAALVYCNGTEYVRLTTDA